MQPLPGAARDPQRARSRSRAATAARCSIGRRRTTRSWPSGSGIRSSSRSGSGSPAGCGTSTGRSPAPPVRRGDVVVGRVPARRGRPHRVAPVRRGGVQPLPPVHADAVRAAGAGRARPVDRRRLAPDARSGRARINRIEGKLTWRARVGDEVVSLDAAGFGVEFSATELEWFRREHLRHDEVARAFGLSMAELKTGAPGGASGAGRPGA